MTEMLFLRAFLQLSLLIYFVCICTHAYIYAGCSGLILHTNILFFFGWLEVLTHITHHLKA